MNEQLGKAQATIEHLAALAHLPEEQAVNFVMLAVMTGRLREQVAAIQAERDELAANPLRCPGTPSWTRYLLKDNTIRKQLRLVHSIHVEVCPYCGERAVGKKNMRPYVREENHEEALQAVANQRRLDRLEAWLKEAGEALERTEQNATQWRALNKLLDAVPVGEEGEEGEAASE